MGSKKYYEYCLRECIKEGRSNSFNWSGNTLGDRYRESIKKYQDLLDDLKKDLPKEKEYYKREYILDRFGNRLKLGDIIVTGGSIGRMYEYMIRDVSKSGLSLMRFELNANYVPDFRTFKTRKDVYISLFNSFEMDFFIIKEDQLSDVGKEGLKELRKHKWFRNDYM